jgi:hypothetical protein
VGERGALTRHDVLRVIGAFILDEAESVHELDLSNGSMSKLIEEIFNFLLVSCFFLAILVSGQLSVARAERKRTRKKIKRF